MTIIHTIRLSPQTNVRAVQGDKIFFQIPKDKLRHSGLKRKKRLERYNQYKVDLKSMCRIKGFDMPLQGCSIKFYIPMPKSWRYWQRAVMNGTLCLNRPDLDNLLKAVLDSLFTEDGHIAQFDELVKFWVDDSEGWIDFEVSEPKYRAIEMPRTKKAAIANGLIDKNGFLLP